MTAAAAALLLTAWSLARMTLDRTPRLEAGAGNLASLAPFWIASALAWAALTGLWVWLGASPRNGLCGAGGEGPVPRFAATTALIVGIAVAGRLAVLLGHGAALSDDLYRYVFDGRNAAAGLNPYLLRPEDARAAATEDYPGQRALAARVNNPEMNTVYLPASQWVFRAAATLVPEGTTDPDRAGLLFRAVFLVLEIGTMLLLAEALRGWGRSPWWLALYAWHPLPLAEIAGSGHQDVIGIALLTAGLLLYLRAPRGVARWTAALAVAALVKPLTVPVAALLLRGRPRRQWLIALAVGAAVSAAVAGPLLLADGASGARHLGATASRFTLKWAHFGSVYEPLLAAIEQVTPRWGNDPQEQLARTICAALLAAALLLIWRRGRDPWRDAALLFLAMVLLSPVAHPWYLLWALVLLPMAPSRAVWAASLTLPWGYAALGDPVDWTVPVWVMIAAYAPVYAGLGIDLFAGPGEAGPRPPQTAAS